MQEQIVKEFFVYDLILFPMLKEKKRFEIKSMIYYYYTVCLRLENWEINERKKSFKFY